MTELFRTVLNMSITGAFISLALIILRAAMKKLPKKYSYALWIILGIRLLCPVSLSSAVSLFNLIKPETAESRMVYVPEDIEYSPAPRMTLPPADNAVNKQAENPAPAVKKHVDPMKVCSVIWFAGAAAMAAYTVTAYILVYKKVKKAIPVQGNVFICREIDSPFVYGIFRPRIYLSDGIPAEEAEFILAHENAHIRRGDHIVKLIAMAALCIHWFNPLAWLSYMLMTRDMELSCDEIAVTGFDHDVRKEYAETLLNMSMRQNKIALGGILAFGESGIKTRIKSVLSAKKPRVAAAAAAAVIVSASSVCLLTNASCLLVSSEYGYALIKQETVTYAYGSRATRAESDAKEAVRLINRLSCKKTDENLEEKLPQNYTSYSLYLYKKYEPALITIASPDIFSYYIIPKFMKIEDENGAEYYLLSDKDYEKLAQFMMKHFEAFPEGVYKCTAEDAYVVVSKKDGKTYFEYSENGAAEEWGTPDSYGFCGTGAFWGGCTENGIRGNGKGMKYLGNGMLRVTPELGRRIHLGVFIRNTTLAELSGEVYQASLVSAEYSAHALEIDGGSDYGVIFVLPSGWTLRAPEEGISLCFSMLPIADIYDENGVFKGTAAYNSCETYSDIPDGEYCKAVCGGLALSPAIAWDMDSYVPASNCGRGENAVINASAAKDGKTAVYPSVISCAKGINYYFCIQFEEGALTEKQMKIAASRTEFIDKKQNRMLSAFSGGYLSSDYKYELRFSHASYVGGSIFEEKYPPDFRFALYGKGELIADGMCGYNIEECSLDSYITDPESGEKKQCVFAYENGSVKLSFPDGTRLADYPAEYFREKY